MYQIKPKVRNPAYEKARKEKQRLKQEEAKKIAAKQKEEMAEQANKDRMHTEVVSSIDNNTESLQKALLSLKDQVAQIDIEIPEFDGSEIVKAIEESTNNLNGTLDGLNKQISKIKLDVPKIDMDKYTKSVTTAMNKNTSDLKAVLEEVRKQISAIRLETDEPITDWRFHIVRDNTPQKDIEYIDAKANINRTIN